MARIDYYNIETELQTILNNDISGAMVTVEEEIMSDVDMTPWFGIYLARREAPENQSLSAGQRTRFRLHLEVWVFCWSFDGVRQASEFRDDNIGKAEVAIMGNRTLNGTVDTCWLEGGEFTSAKDDNNGLFLSGGQIRVVCDVTATTN